MKRTFVEIESNPSCLLFRLETVQPVALLFQKIVIGKSVIRVE